MPYTEQSNGWLLPLPPSLLLASPTAAPPHSGRGVGVSELLQLPSQPASGRGRARSGSPFSNPQAASAFLLRNHSPPRAQRRAPSPQCLYCAPLAEVTRSELPFSCSRCHDSPASTWCRPPTPPRQRPTRRPLLTRFNPAAAPQSSVLTGKGSPRLRGPPRGSTGLVVPRGG